jgi:hypothetical protein
MPEKTMALPFAIGPSLSEIRNTKAREMNKRSALLERERRHHIGTTYSGNDPILSLRALQMNVHCGSLEEPIMMSGIRILICEEAEPQL